MFEDYKKSIVIIGMIVLFLGVFFTTYASLSELESRGLLTKILRVDEAAYGKLSFDSSNLKFGPILDSDVSNSSDSVIHIDFRVGGSEENNVDEIIYDIALADLEVDCVLLSPYLKWRLFKNGEVISEGSLDYKFDTIKDGRLVLTPIQQDLKKYSKDKNTYDYYEFYMWISDSFQKENLEDYSDEIDQSYLMGKKIKGRIEIDLYGAGKKELVRNPSDELDTNTCIMEES